MTRQAALLLPLCLCCTALFAQQQNDVNVALNKNYSQSTSYPTQGPSSMGANGNTSEFFPGNCIHTLANYNNPWWQVDLGRTYPVQRIDVWSRHNFKSRLYPSTITVNDQTCASITNYPTDSRKKEVTCSSVMYGQKVRITRTGDNEPLNMCEMQIWVPSEVSQCEVGKYGPECSSDCSSNCGKGQGKNFCYKSNGYCYDGCVDGWYGDQCSSPCSPGCQNTACDQQNGQCSCKTGYEGNTCADCQYGYYKTSAACQRCSANCQSQICDKNTGKCEGCVDGRYGDLCTSFCLTPNCQRCDQNTGSVCSQCTDNSFLLPQACTDCRDGYYKRTNNQCQQCSANCKSGTICDKITGYCSMCPPGKKGNFCTEDCAMGSYGQNCTEQCGHCRRDSSSYCRADSGACTDGCLPGWQMQLCKTECQDGSYGMGCSYRCGRCKGGAACNKTDGHCSGCEAGWNVPKCNTECPAGWYGESCAHECGSCFGGVACNKTSGHCRCSTGKQPPYCQTDCQGGRYGQDCAEKCGECRGGQTCNPVTGHCSTGCKPGWIDLMPSLNINLCKSECPDGYYGEGCNQTCGNCQNSTECRHDTGVCTGLCSEGFTGLYCAKAVTDDGSPTATIAGAVVAAVVVIVIVVLVVIIVVRRRTQSAKSNALVAESSEISNNSQNRRDPERSGASSLSFDSINSKGDKPNARLETQVKPVVKAAIKSAADHAEGHVYENVFLPKQNSASKDTPALPKQSNKKNGRGSIGKQAKPLGKTAKSAPGTENSAPATETSPTDDEELESMWTGEAIYSNDPTKPSFQPTPIRLDQLQKTIMGSVKDGTVSEEFGHLEGLKEYPVTHGKRQENYYKNRFNSILPYDKDRVVLDQVDGDDSSDYINASFIKGYKTKKAYIASQGPRPNTQDDFWRMVWQERVTDIVMLTNITEGNKPKCHEYWPAEGRSLNTGHLQVTTVEEQERAHFVIRTFNIRTLQSKEKRQVMQYHYIKWMDHEVPATTPLVDFWRYVRARAPRTLTAPPLLVHCSAGVGRTGTYIALDILIDQSQQEQEISLYSTVDKLRNYRCHMVQNKGQYKFLHEAVLEAYMSGDSRLETSSFDNIFSLTINHDQAHPRIDAEYERLDQMRTCLVQPCHSTANLDENRQKNRNPDILPDDNHLVFITEHVKGRNQYINAIYLPTFLSSRGSILTQLPLADTVIDLWRLVDSWDVNTIVSIGQADMDCYWPRQTGQTVNRGAYTVTLLSKTSPGDTLNTYTVQMKKEGKTHELQVLHFEAWTGEVADNIPDLINLLGTLDTAHKQATNRPIIVQCIDGAAQSGALCVLWDVISRVMYDDDIDVYLAVRHVHTVRPEAITSVVQYRFIYEVIQQYRSSSNIYVNT